MLKMPFKLPKITIPPKSKTIHPAFFLPEKQINFTSWPNFSNNFKKQFICHNNLNTAASEKNKRAKANRVLKKFSVDLYTLSLLEHEKVFKDICIKYKSEPSLIPYVARRLLSVCDQLTVKTIFYWIIEINNVNAICELLGNEYFKSFMRDKTRGQVAFWELVKKAVDENGRDIVARLITYADFIIKIVDKSLVSSSFSPNNPYYTVLYASSALFSALEKKNNEVANLLWQSGFNEKQKQEIVKIAETIYSEDCDVMRFLRGKVSVTIKNKM